MRRDSDEIPLHGVKRNKRFQPERSANTYAKTASEAAAALVLSQSEDVLALKTSIGCDSANEPVRCSLW